MCNMMHLVIINVLVLYFIFNVRVIINKSVCLEMAYRLCQCFIYKSCLALKLHCFAHYETLLFQIAAVKAFFKGTMCIRY